MNWIVFIAALMTGSIILAPIGLPILLAVVVREKKRRTFDKKLLEALR